MDEESDKIERLEDRIDQLEATIAKMLPGGCFCELGDL